MLEHGELEYDDIYIYNYHLEHVDHGGQVTLVTRDMEQGSICGHQGTMSEDSMSNLTTKVHLDCLLKC